MTSCYESCFVSAIVFHRINHVTPNLLVLRTGLISLSHVLEGVVLVYLLEFNLFCFLPASVSVVVVNLDGLFVIARNLITEHVHWSGTERV